MVLGEAAVRRLISPFLVPFAGQLSNGLPSVVGRVGLWSRWSALFELTSTDRLGLSGRYCYEDRCAIATRRYE